MINSSPHEPAKLFDANQLATSVQEVAIDVVRGESTEFLTRWYRTTKGDADLTIWWDGEKRVVKQQLCLYGQVVEWNPIHGTRTGLIVEHESLSAVQPGTDEANEPASEIIRFDKKTARSAVGQAVHFVGLLTAVGAEDRALLAYNFRESPRLHKNARERALKAWAPQGAEILSSERPGFWRNLSQWIFGK